PRDVEPTLGRIGKTLKRIAVDRVDSDTLTSGDDADDAVARERVATAGEMQRHARDQTANRYRRLVLFHLTPSPSQRDNLALGFLRLREGGVGYRAPGDETLADGDIEILDAGAVEVLEYRLERPLRELLALLAERLLHDRPPEIEVLRALLGTDETANAGASLAGDDKPLPGRRGRLRLRGDDLDLIAVVQLATQRHHAAVDLRADASVADLGMHRIGEIDRGGAARKRDQITLGGKSEDLVLEHLELGVLEELLRPRGVIEDVQELAQPAILRSLGLTRALLVAPVGGDTELGDLVHLAGADLHLDALLLGTDDPGMQ